MQTALALWHTARRSKKQPGPEANATGARRTTSRPRAEKKMRPGTVDAREKKVARREADGRATEIKKLYVK